MEEFKKPEELKSKELGKELFEEWYAEKEKTEKLSRGQEEQKDGSKEREKIFFGSSSPQQKDEEELKEKDDQKKLKVRNKIKYLLVLGEKRGLGQAIKEAKKENDPFLLDVFHDLLARDGAYKKFLKK